MILKPKSLLLLAGILLITSPCSSERITGVHPRGSIPYPKTLVLADPGNPGKNVTVFMYSATEVQPLFNPAADIKFYMTKVGQSRSSLIDLKKVQTGDPEGQWYFGVHGWLESYLNSPIIPELVRDIQASGSSNIIHVDWKEGASSLYYPTAAENTKAVGSYVADVINSLVEQGFAKKDKIHLIGFSLGGHVVGFVGKNIISKYNWKLKKITGLDPAGPLFSYAPASGRLDSRDAEYVEIFHTCGGFLGIWEPHGLVDVYVNTGMWLQPGCGWDVNGECSHKFAIRTYGGYTNLAMRSYRCTSFTDFSWGHCNDDLQTYCEVGFKYPNCREGVYHLDTTRYFN